MTQLTHLDENGAARMVDVGDKAITERLAVAGATVSMRAETLALLEQGAHKKGDVLAVARIAGIQAAKKCSDLIPLCHPLLLNSEDVKFHIDVQARSVHVEGSCKVSGKTGVEMEAQTAVTVAAQTNYDMCKAVDPGKENNQVGQMEKNFHLYLLMI